MTALTTTLPSSCAPLLPGAKRGPATSSFTCAVEATYLFLFAQPTYCLSCTRHWSLVFQSEPHSSFFAYSASAHSPTLVWSLAMCPRLSHSWHRRLSPHRLRLFHCCGVPWVGCKPTMMCSVVGLAFLSPARGMVTARLSQPAVLAVEFVRIAFCQPLCRA